MNGCKPYQRGNTITIEARFYKEDSDNEDGVTLCDPDNDTVKFILYDYKYRPLQTVPILTLSKVSTGVYRHDFIPQHVGEYIYEFYGEIAGLPSLHRNMIRIVEV